jgi:hypothetical protein
MGLDWLRVKSVKHSSFSQSRVCGQKYRKRMHYFRKPAVSDTNMVSGFVSWKYYYSSLQAEAG